jgi:ribose/xylose/arabinose/galactoside ABC-type transport system permease subunit
LQSSTRGIAGIGQLFVLLTGGIDLSVGGLAILTAIVGARLMTGTTAFPYGPIALMLVLGIVVGTVNGTLVSRVGMPPLIVTLGMWQITKGFGYLISGGLSIRNLPEQVSFFGAGHIAGVPVPVIIFIAVAATAYFVLYYTTFGRRVYAVGGNPASAWLSGINVSNIQFSVYILSGFLASLAGFILMARAMTGSLSMVAGLELDSIAGVTIGGVSLAGGRGSLIGAVIGVIILGVISNGMNVYGLDPNLQDIVKGVIIIAAVAVDSIRRKRGG